MYSEILKIAHSIKTDIDEHLLIEDLHLKKKKPSYIWRV